MLLALVVQATPAQTSRAEVSTDSTAALSRGQVLSTAIATVTSTAISPLFGVCLLGIYDYYRTPKAQRGSLPLYDSPKFWIPIGALLILILIKDTFGGMTPLLKKPLDAIEVLMLNKASLFLLAFPVVFHEVAEVLGFSSLGKLFAFLGTSIEPVVQAAGLAEQSGLSHAANASLAVLMIIAGLAMTIVVWLVSHAVDVILLLNPFPFLDLLVKGLRNAILILTAGTALINREAGLILSLCIIFICGLLFWRALRIVAFGTIFAWDLLGLLIFRRRPRAPLGAVHVFTAKKVQGVPKGTLGTLTLRAGGTLEFRYHPFVFGLSRSIGLMDSAKLEVGRGLIHSCIISPSENPDHYTFLFRLLPRYTGSEEAVRSVLGLAKVRDIRWPKGLLSLRNWLKSDSVEAADPV